MAIPFSGLRPVEDRLWRAVVRAGGTLERAVEVDAADATAKSVRGDFLAWLLAEGAAKAAPLLVRLTLMGAGVDGPFDLRGLRLTLTPRFVGCALPNVELCDATIVGFEMLAGTASTVDADRLSTNGALTIRATVDHDQVPKAYGGEPVIQRQLRLNGATIRGNLDLRGCLIHGEEPSDGIALFADGLTVLGNALIGDGFSARGEVRLNGCQIGRNLDFSGARLVTRDRRSLTAAQARISGSLLLCQTEPRLTNRQGAAFSSIGIVALTGTQIAGDFDCDGGRFTAPGFASPPPPGDDPDAALAVRAAGLAVGGVIWMGKGFYARGCVHLVNAKVGSDLQCQGGHFDHPGDLALEADGIQVGGTTFFEHGARLRCRAGQSLPSAPLPARTSGFLSFNYARLEQGLYIDGLVFRPRSRVIPPPELDRRGSSGLLGDLATIRGDFRLHQVKRIGSAPGSGIEFTLRQAKADVLDDESESWAVAATLNVTAFEYNAIRGLKPDDDWRCDLLDRHYVADRHRPAEERATQFEPQPYLRLAKIMQQAGFGAAATRTRIRLEVAQTRAGDFGWWRRLWRHLLWLTTRYGYQPIHAIWALLLWTLFSTWAFAYATIGPEGQIVDTKAKTNSPSSMPAASHREFHPFFLALDTVIPVVDLHQKNRFEIKSPSLAYWRQAWRETGYDARAVGPHVWRAFLQFLVPLLGFANLFIGWTLGGLFAAGVSGWLRRGNGGGEG
jgi:hypothetical protein